MANIKNETIKNKTGEIILDCVSQEAHHQLIIDSFSTAFECTIFVKVKELNSWNLTNANTKGDQVVLFFGSFDQIKIVPNQQNATYDFNYRQF